MQEVKHLLFEPIARAETFTEEKALRYGFPDNKRMVNIITVKNFRAVRMRAYESTSTNGRRLDPAAYLLDPAR